MSKAMRLCCNTLETIGEALDMHNLDRESGKIFVTGGSGVVGRRVAMKLLDTGCTNVRLGTGKTDSLYEMHQKGAEIVDFSWNREETYANALKGIKSVFITIPYEKNWHKHFQSFLKACKKAQVKHFVKVSFHLSKVSDDVFHRVPLVKRHANCDELLMKMIMPDEEHLSRMSYTILYASHFMSNPLIFHGKELRSIQASSTIYDATRNHSTNYVSPNDVAEVAVRTLLAPRDHYNRFYTITGPELTTNFDIAILLSKYFNKSIQCVDQHLSEYSDNLKRCGMAKWWVKDLVSMQRIIATGFEEKLGAWNLNDFERICGHPPESFADYLTRTETMTKMESGDSTCQTMSRGRIYYI
jgi:NAD(P)H dehydrogenase (quinone)